MALQRRRALWPIVMTAAAAGLSAVGAYGAPNLQKAFTVGQVKVYPDHARRNVFYYAPRPLRLHHVNGQPVFRFDLFRYWGRKETGDSDVFRVRGVLTFQVERPQDLRAYQELALAVQQTYPGAVLRPAPISKFASKLIYRTVEASGGGKAESGVIEGGVSRAVGEEGDDEAKEGHWKQRRFTIGLAPHTAELFWRAFEQNRLVLSLIYSSHVLGVVPNDKANDAWQESTVELADALPIDVSMAAHPSAFRRTDIGYSMKMAHTTVTVLCYDFINETKPNLYSVQVEVMFRTLRDQDYIERVKFIENDDEYEREISFRLAKDLGAGYQFRVQRIFKDGRHEKTAWQKHNGQQLDVTYYVQ